jgi:hypothetical protein
MKPFEFFFEGRPNNANGTVDAGIKMMSGEPFEIALALGTYADQAIRQLGEPQAAIIVLNAFKKFMELNPDMGQKVLSELMGQDGARIVKANGMPFIKPFKKN